MVLESGLLQEREERYELTGPLPPLAIPTTLHDSLMARLDRLAPVKGLAQLGATLGREFSYELLHAVSPWDEETLQQGLHQLVAAEFLYQRGLPPQATYLFKHALIQDAAYQSLLKSTRQQYHQRIAQVLETQFPETAETQPEVSRITTRRRVHCASDPLLAAGGANGPSNVRPIWRRSATDSKGWSCSRRCRRRPSAPCKNSPTEPLGRVLCCPPKGLQRQRSTGLRPCPRPVSTGRDTAHLGQVLFGLWGFYQRRADLQTARELAEQLAEPGATCRDPARLQAHAALGTTCSSGDNAAARCTWSRGSPLRRQYRDLAPPWRGAWARCLALRPGLWCLGIRRRPWRSEEGSPWRRRWPIPIVWRMACYAAFLHYRRREAPAVQAQAETSWP